MTPPHSPVRDAWRPWLAARADELTAAVAFSTRLPLPLPRTATFGGAGIGQAGWALPVAGLVVGIVGALVFALARHLGIPDWPAAALTVAATMALTGCLHEDGLADTIDGFGGGATREQKLDIMRDARIGTYGVAALSVSILVRAGALASLPDTAAVIWALIAAHTGARAMMPLMMFFVAPARSDGLSFAAGRPPLESAAAAAVLGLLALIIGLGFWRAIEAAIVLAIVLFLMAWLSTRQIGGQTGDVLGALEQVSEIAVLLVAVR
jgi:adenosylcobinamide-GDP ribazoletransferase